MPKKQLRSYSLEEMVDKYIGKKGTPARNKYEKRIRMEILGRSAKMRQVLRK